MADKLTSEGHPEPHQGGGLPDAKSVAKPETAASAGVATGAGSPSPAEAVAKGVSDGPKGVPSTPLADVPAQPRRLWRFRGLDALARSAWYQVPSWLVSMVVHMLLLLALALLSLSEGATDEVDQLVLARGETQQLDNLDELDYELPEELDISPELLLVEGTIDQVDVEVSSAEDLDAAAAAVELADFGFSGVRRDDLLATAGAGLGDELSGRGEASRARLVRDAGGTEASEQAVAAGLRWLAAHQLPDGGWSFQHTRAPGCNGQCRNPGTLADARIGATAIALLPFLGAGQTHRTGNYRTAVKAGIQYLVGRMRRTSQGGNLWEPGGRMYSHGLASIVLCEAYAMTQDRTLREPAQAAIDFICYAQDPVGGGWRYDPRQKGDTSVLGWQVMALKSAHLAYLRVPPETIKKAYRFLDSVQYNDGAAYGYIEPEVHAAGAAVGGTTAVGLLCRMYLGWKKDHPPLQQGVEWLSELRPSTYDMYYNYYATQVMRHWEGELWEKWNNVMRDQLVNSQATKGHEAGSWYFPGTDLGADGGGRLYFTAMATMTLEVYYRHLPIYRKQSVDEVFPE